MLGGVAWQEDVIFYTDDEGKVDLGPGHALKTRKGAKE